MGLTTNINPTKDLLVVTISFRSFIHHFGRCVGICRWVEPQAARHVSQDEVLQQLINVSLPLFIHGSFVMSTERALVTHLKHNKSGTSRRANFNSASEVSSSILDTNMAQKSGSHVANEYLCT